jgi:arabinogalactan endo-1,4-beta-galactosidase
MSKIRLSLLAALSLGLVLGSLETYGQSFYFGADLSYVNEMEDCGVSYKEDGKPKDVHEMFADHGCNLVRLRLWHTPSWYDGLNNGNRYSDLADVKIAIGRAHAAGMEVLLDFHLSDNWADPGKQVIPAAWVDVVDNLPVLQDSLFNYIHSVLSELHQENLLPEMVQIGNETNKGILQSQAANDGGWVLDWERNSTLFNTAIYAVQAVEVETGEDIKIAIHAAGPTNAVWLFDQFLENGVTEFDIMGISYYWAWHKPTDIDDTGQIIANLQSDHPGYDVMIFETGYIWTTQSNDNANNIINSVHPDYSPASPANQRLWLEALTQEVINRGGKGVIYWEPAWVSSSCWTQWGHGSHQEHATFFDFVNNLLETGGMFWMTFPYENLSSITAPDNRIDAAISVDSNTRQIHITVHGYSGQSALHFLLTSTSGQIVLSLDLNDFNVNTWTQTLELPELPKGIYIGSISDNSGRVFSEKLIVGE